MASPISLWFLVVSSLNIVVSSKFILMYRLINDDDDDDDDDSERYPGRRILVRQLQLHAKKVLK